MDDEALYPIGALAERTGLTVKTIRFYADRGIVPPTEFTPAGYRLYNAEAIARLELVRTLRDLGVDLATIRRVLAGETTVAEVAATHAEAIDLQITLLRLRRAVLRAVAKRESNPQEMTLMHKLIQLSEAERHRLIHDFIDDTFGSANGNPEMADLVRASMPHLPEDPTPQQLEAWIDLADLTQNPDFRAAVRRMVAYQAKERAAGETTGLHHDLTEAVTTEITAALEAGITPDSPTAATILNTLTARYAETFAKPDDPALRHWILERLTIANDPRVEEYWRLLSTINAWPPFPNLTPIFTWFAAALRSH
ncbi:MerR family transcriptional regulator [Nocardia sp. SYP-A9097]|uniref:helix-turn-helix domain-containing protein n=1 Tax=Nocardia sp. SYP-A9097 TaxID=2663237 RepID=UPI00129AE9CD|nr:MerR family transcriptional regulator [Nocardia sp. SYP-A9097]MRH92738.1 MerR family transcriptional regulator [Nocardia sp. SYP-A9097]